MRQPSEATFITHAVLYLR